MWFSIGMFVVSLTATMTHAWEFDFSRRQKHPEMKTTRVGDAPVVPTNAESYAHLIPSPSAVERELVILNTERGFVPNQLSVRKGEKYLIHIVNINEKDKNVSFVMDHFHHYGSTYYGKMKSFRIEPKTEGIFSFQCPESSFEGRLVVVGETPELILRQPASPEN